MRFVTTVTVYYGGLQGWQEKVRPSCQWFVKIPSLATWTSRPTQVEEESPVVFGAGKEDGRVLAIRGWPYSLY